MSGIVGFNQRKSTVAASAPINCVMMKPGASAGLIPAKVSVNDRASVTAGFANDVDAVNQYAAVIYAPTANGTAVGLAREHPQITDNNPKVATNSLKSCAGPLRMCCEICTTGNPNIRCAAQTPQKPPTHWARM